MENEIVIQSNTDLIAAVIATLFTPKEVCEDTIIYDKETIYNLASLLDEVCQKWYNVDLEVAELELKLEKGTE